MTEATTLCFIGGERISGGGRETFASVNPATGDLIGEVAVASDADLDAAVEAAKEAQKIWWSWAPSVRAEKLWRWSDLLEQNGEQIAQLDSKDMGKLLASARLEVGAGARNVRYWSAVAARPLDESIPTIPGHLNYTRREPLGVVGVIIPWNGPSITFTGRVASALAYGNGVAVKPSEMASMSAGYMAELTVAAGIPIGLVNIIHGDGMVGDKMVGHPRIGGVSFTGSVNTGRKVAERAASSFTKTVLELGGKGPVIVFDDADLDTVARASVWGCYESSGQVCCAGTRILVSRNRQNELEDLLAAYTSRVRVGDPADASTQVGPVVSETQLERVAGFVDRAVAEGARPVVGGHRIDSRGFFFEPTLFAGLDREASILREEVFGPVLAVVGFDGEDDAVALANDTTLGLAAGIWTRDGGRFVRIADRLETGVVWGNTPRLMDPSLPFGGFKDSGIGNASGSASADGLTRIKRVSLRVTEDPMTPWDLGTSV